MKSISIDVENLTVAYHGKVALHGASLQIKAGSISGLVGMNGSGKSTLFKAIMGFLKPVTGQVLINGLPIKTVQKKSLVAYVPQSEEVDWNFPVSVEDVVMMGRYGYMNILRIPAAKDHRVVRESLERVQMWSMRDRQIGELSGGQKKRAFLARALAQQGTVLLLDEPFTGVDIKTEKAMIDLLLELREEGHTILISTHDLASITTFCDQVVLINRTILAYGNTSEVFTEENLSRTFGGSLGDLSFSKSQIIRGKKSESD
ncbi:metal ABC transporter ATP-binding protein [Nostoc sp. 'Lobaria pulmonaria (5183) cyanobiont']|uniref:metal ABC transporter ATP-binding protein n=1 Tax=Nostoc sp. 'Lobaria pulmonaria (5183) cyanobiont' TaxID=1618022 RepID=UPI000CF340EA|nr:metal ABC transporter ATP-binding protein [Nostoc sp. 'Lobaria pulmonaria (5183) cyanobiont']AVH71338.1 iron ABC transporter ATP-binding protein [Nostoc sp. 'Lobaria pulmonaria (5183) cyanobiont']